MKTILRDKTHGCRRVISKPWSAVQAMQDAFSAVIGKPKGIARIIQSSKGISKMFHRACQEVLDAPCSGKRVKNLQYRKHRFDSQQRPLAKFILFFDAFVKVAIHLAADRNHSDTAHAEEFLSQVTDQQLILLSMCADASDEAVRLIRYFDSDTWDIASMQYECSVYASRLKHLFLDGQVVHSGYTQHMLETLKKSRGWLCRGRPRSIPWRRPCRVCRRSSESRSRLCERNFRHSSCSDRSWFSMSKVDGTSWRLKICKRRRLCQVLGFGFEEFLGEFAAHQPVAFYEARSGKDNFDAWKSAVLKSRLCRSPCASIIQARFSRKSWLQSLPGCPLCDLAEVIDRGRLRRTLCRLQEAQAFQRALMLRGRCMPLQIIQTIRCTSFADKDCLLLSQCLCGLDADPAENSLTPVHLLCLQPRHGSIRYEPVLGPVVTDTSNLRPVVTETAAAFRFEALCTAHVVLRPDCSAGSLIVPLEPSIRV